MTFRNKASSGTLKIKERKPNNLKIFERKKIKGPKEGTQYQLYIWCELGIENTCN